MSPVLRLASFAVGSGHVNLVARAGTSEIAKVLDDPKYPPEYPFGEKEMQRYDESSDFIFYSQPRFVRHIDDDAIKALTKYYASVFPPAGRTTSPSWTCAAVGSATTPRDTPPGASPGSA